MINRTAARTSLKLLCDTGGDDGAQRADRIGHMPLRPTRCREGGNPRVRQALVVEQRFFTAMSEALVKQEGVRRLGYRQCPAFIDTVRLDISIKVYDGFSSLSTGSKADDDNEYI